MGVEGAEGEGEGVDGVEVCVVFLEDDGSQGFFLAGAGRGLVFFGWGFGQGWEGRVT